MAFREGAVSAAAPQHYHATFDALPHCSCMGNPLATRIALLQAAAARDEAALARQRVAIEALRSEGHRTTEAEKSYERFEGLHQGLLRKLAALQWQG